MNNFYSVKLIKLNEIEVVFTPQISLIDNSFIFNFVHNNKKEKLTNFVVKQKNGSTHINFILPFDYPFNEECLIEDEKLGSFYIALDNVPSFKEFDELFNYDGELGPDYSKESTSFRLWAPLSNKVTLVYEDKDGFKNIDLIRENNGVYHIDIFEDLLNKRYYFEIISSGVKKRVLDPYAKMIDETNTFSVVVNPKEIAKKARIEPKTAIKKNIDAIIYELHVSDFTLNKHMPIVNKGKFLGLIEDNVKTFDGHPLGLDYLKDLGVTHVQLLPVLDYFGDNNVDQNETYNWGYDPVSWFALEGRYSSKVNAYQYRLEEFRQVVDTFHKNDLRINLDLIFNHVYDHLHSSIENIVPNYYFRKDKNGLNSCASGCGNDIASERYMVRKLILDSVSYLFETFDIDGVRLDLMGLLDINTVKEMHDLIKRNKQTALIYGEGWNMCEELKDEDKACSDNASKMEDIGFFNETYRDIVKGSSFDLDKKGFLSGDFSYADGFIYAFMGSCVDYIYKNKFISANQSINYVECHDNNTLYDKLLISNENEDEEIRLRRIKLMNALTVLSFGVPFIHMGQEIGLSKEGLNNTYNIPKINNFYPKYVDERYDMIDSLKDIISLRNNELSFLKEISDPKEIEEMVNYQKINDSILRIDFKGKDITFLINVTNKNQLLELGDYYQTLFIYGDDNNSLKLNSVILPPISLTILRK